MTKPTITSGRVLLLRPGDTLIIAGLGTYGPDEHDQLHDAIVLLKEAQA